MRDAAQKRALASGPNSAPYLGYLRVGDMNLGPSGLFREEK